MTVIRNIRAADLPAVMEIEREAIHPPWTEGALLAEIGHADSIFLVAEAQTRVLGFILLRAGLDEAELYQIAVRHEARGQGIGAQLMTAALQNAAGRGTVAVFLEVREGNAEARRLYTRYRFREINVRKDYYSHPTENAVVMKMEMGDSGAHTFSGDIL